MKPLRVTHLPVYDNNPYQSQLMTELNRLGVHTMDGGGGGRFLRSALTRWNADVLHFHWIHPYLLGSNVIVSLLRCCWLILTLMLVRMTGTRIVWTVHNLSNHDELQLRAERICTRAFLMFVDAILCHTETAREAVITKFKIKNVSKVYVVPHGHYASYYPNIISREVARKELCLKTNEMVFLMLGRIQPYKGIEKLVHQFMRMPQTDVRLLLAGAVSDEELIGTIHRWAVQDKRIIFHPGYIPDGKIQVYLNAADAVVLPYQEVLSSGSLILAMSFARSCIAVRKGDLPEVLAPGGGYLYSETDSNGLLSAMGCAYREREKLLEMGRANFQQVRPWNWEHIAAEIADIYRDCLSPKVTKTGRFERERYSLAPSVAHDDEE